MKKIYFSLVIHNHQPVGNFGFVFEKAYGHAYEPMVRLLERHPLIKCTLHYSGCLLDWIFDYRPAFIERLRRLVARGQVEIMTGGYYEPILVAIPDKDKIGQLAKLTKTVKKQFLATPRGAWLAERVWEPHLAENLCDAGVEYTILDDTHFKYAGLNEEDLFGYYVTEEQGKPLKVFSTLKKLRYSIPWDPVERVIDWFKQKANERGEESCENSAFLAMMGDDGEKFGLWPGTFEHCWGSGDKKSNDEGWMEEFFLALEENKDWLETINPSEFIDKYEPAGRIYLPAASYDEMTEWVLPPDLGDKLLEAKKKGEVEKQKDFARFLRGGFWRNFMVKYPEINTMHKKMLRVSKRLHSIPTTSKLLADKVDKVDKAFSHLWAGQCNCPYWHGVFGGVYLFHLRSAIFNNLIEAENLADKVEEDRFSCDIVDFDIDGRKEIVLESPMHNVLIDPGRGGAVFEWDWKESAFNLVNVMTRTRERYHKDFLKALKENRLILSGEVDAENIHTEKVRVKEKGLEKHLYYDRYRRAVFVEHFLDSKITAEDLYRGMYEERGDFYAGKYQFKIKRKSKAFKVGLARNGRYKKGNSVVPLILEKEITFPKDKAGLDVSYVLERSGGEAENMLFGVETNWALMGGTDSSSFMVIDYGKNAGQKNYHLDSMGDLSGVRGIDIYLEVLKMTIRIETEEPARIIWYPIETISNSEEGFERIYQGLCMVCLWELSVSNEKFCKKNIRVKVGRWPEG